MELDECRRRCTLNADATGWGLDDHPVPIQSRRRRRDLVYPVLIQSLAVLDGYWMVFLGVLDGYWMGTGWDFEVYWVGF